MRVRHNRSACSMLLVSVSCAVLTVFLLSCSTQLPVQQESQESENSILETQFSIVCFIHGDGDYLYHDTSGNEYEADEESLAAVTRVAQQNPNAEVFIFHQRPRQHFLLFFPLRDGEFYYYRNGRLIANELYWRDQEQSNFDIEVGLYRRFRAENRSKMLSLFLYFGHEIPEFAGAGYDASYPDRTFTVHDLANGVKEFAPDSSKFDLMILSTCFGGTPYTISMLGSFSRTIIASPDNLHLSYFNLHPLTRLDLSLQDGDVHAFAKRFAQQAFERLTSEIQTAVSVVAYDIDKVQKYTNSVHGIYDHTLNKLNEVTQDSLSKIGRCDCADLPVYSLPTMSEGVDVFYRPARFGRLKHKQFHSGWECWEDDYHMQSKSL